MADLIPFPRLGYNIPMPANLVAGVFTDPLPASWARENPCANGMPGHPPCRSPAELEALLRARADVTAAREGV